MTTWAIQPTHYGNEVKIWADVFHNDHFADAKRRRRETGRIARRTDHNLESKGSISEFKWMEVK